MTACLLLLAGCQPPPAARKETPPMPLGERFDAKATGTIRGQVVWSGAIPKVDAIKLLVSAPGLENEYPNPNAPTIDLKTQAMADVLMFLRKVEVARSRPWSHDPVEVAFDDARLQIHQGQRKTRLGIVRRGDEIACVAREKRNHTLEARGASVFSLPLVVPDKITRRKLEQPGILELSSGSALYWLRGHLWIGEHTYAVVTNAAGEFELAQVPAGTYELVSWMPSWHIKRRERGPEFGEIERLIFVTGVEQSAEITVVAGEAAKTVFRWDAARFNPPK
jgi:hypothetical protein